MIKTFRQPLVKPLPEADLTRREQEVLESLMKGSSDKEIADKLSISLGTVRYYLKNICAKLHVRSLTEAVLKLRTEKSSHGGTES